ncbi:unnamed protein product [Nippostrongylus brasiliensis]|uniref:GYF domain-containing protein n=1 Tax=Nippostrongylus brasiliensis TaxID=27835 RepID=A0A0N4XZS3_NIPBR|nr:unnamed protein product [Nippostrongylus brasiliensis]
MAEKSEVAVAAVGEDVKADAKAVDTATNGEVKSDDTKKEELNIEWLEEAADSKLPADDKFVLPQSLPYFAGAIWVGEGSAETVAEDKGPWRPTDDAGDAAAPDAKKEEGESADAVQASKKKQRVYKRKVVRIPKEVFDYMARVEEDGVVRINVTQLSVYLTHQLLTKATSVEASEWATTDAVPVLNESVPPTAKANPMLIVDNFDASPEQRASQEERLQNILLNRHKSNTSKTRANQGNVTNGTPAGQGAAKIQPPQHGDAPKFVTKTQKKREKKQQKATEEGKQTGTNNQESGKKRLAENSVPSSAQGSGTAAKQPRLEVTNSSPMPAGKTPAQSPFGRITPGMDVTRGWQRDGLSAYRNAGGMPGRGMYDDQMRYGRDPYSDRRGVPDVSPWSSRPVNQPDELQKLESIMRRAAQENASTIDAVRAVEKMGLGSAMGAMLNAVDRRDPPAFASPMSRNLPSLVDEPYGRSRGAMRAPNPRAERITYPGMGGCGEGGFGGASRPYGQSYEAFSAQQYGGGGMMGYGRE